MIAPVLEEAHLWRCPISFVLTAKDASWRLDAIKADEDKHEECVSVKTMEDYGKIPVRDFDSYAAVHVIGDVQGCATPLFDALNSVGCPMDDDGLPDVSAVPSHAFVFSGDLFDRGDEAAKVWDWLQKYSSEDNVWLVRGNHDAYLREYGMKSVEGDLPRATKDSIVQIHESAVSLKGKSAKQFRKMARDLYYRYVDALAFKRDGKTYVVTHGGLHPQVVHGMMMRDETTGAVKAFRFGFMSQQATYYGTGRTFDQGDYDVDIDAIIDSYETGLPESERIYQIHGHRNECRHGISDFETVFNLEGQVEHGGQLRMIAL